MNKQEFYNIVQNELDKLEKERKEAQATIDYYDMINEDGSYDNDSFYQEQRKQSEYVLKMCKAKIEKVKDLLGYPLYIRIESMSDFELEQYRTQEISELVSKIKMLREEQNERENKIHELKNRQKELISKLVSSSYVQRDEARKEAKEIFEELKKYDSILGEGAINEEIQELEKQIELLKKKTPDEIKNELLSKVPNNGKHITTATRVSKDYSNFVEDIAENYDKVEKVVDLTLKKQNLEQDSSNRISSSGNQGIYNIRYYMPLSFELNTNIDVLDKKTIEQISDDINEYEEKCRIIEEAFIDNFCMNNDGTKVNEDILDLINKKQHLSTTYIPLQFFSKYEHRFSSYQYVNLITLFREKEELSKKVIKNGNTRSKIERLERDIQDLENSIFYEIRGNYIDDMIDIFDIFTPLELKMPTDGTSVFYNTRHDPAVISSMKHLFDISSNMESFINKVIGQFKYIKEKLDEIKKIVSEEETKQEQEENEINKIDNDIRNLADVKFDTDIPYMGSTKEEIEDFIINNVANNKKYEVATKIEEAPKSKIADLEGLNPEYLEELKKLREKLKEENSNKSKSL